MRIFGLAGWKWLFLCEAAPAVIMGCWVWLYLTDRPETANWLAEDERRWLASVMTEERARVADEKHVSVWTSLIDRRVIALGAIHFAQAGVSVGMAVFIGACAMLFAAGAECAAAFANAGAEANSGVLENGNAGEKRAGDERDE